MSRQSFTAVILAAGIGSRLKPITSKIPKALVTVKEKPLVHWHLDKLKTAGFDKVIINLFYMGEKIEEYLQSYESQEMKITFSRETRLLETAGGIANVLHRINQRSFAVINADVYSDFNFHALKTKIKHLNTDSRIRGHIYLVNNPHHNETGDFSINNGYASNNLTNSLTFSGISVLTKELFSDIPSGNPYQLNKVLRKAVLKDQITASGISCMWTDVGTKERLLHLNNKLRKN